MSDTLEKVYQRLHSMTLKDYDTVERAQLDILDLVLFIDSKEDVETLGLHVKGDDGVWRKVKKD
jgi:hypothetical protein